jgi:hypothetical protein
MLWCDDAALVTIAGGLAGRPVTWQAMAAPRFVHADPNGAPRAYVSPDHVPNGWHGDRPAELDGRQPTGGRLGSQGPDQGYALVLARRFADRLHLQPGEHHDDVVAGCLGVALRRASLFGRAPVIHDLTVAFTVWGYLDADPPADLAAVRQTLFAGVEHVASHYDQARAIVDRVPVETLRMSPQELAKSYPARWRSLLT